MKRGDNDLLRLQHILASIEFINKNIEKQEKVNFIRMNY